MDKQTVKGELARSAGILAAGGRRQGDGIEW